MPRFVKYLLMALAGIILLLVIAVAAVLIFVDPNDYKDDIVKAVHDQTGRELAINGDLSLSVFPWVGIELPALTLSNAKGFGSEPMASINGASVRVKLLPLLSKKVELGRVTLDGASVSLAKNKAGRTNWDDITERLSAKGGSAPASPAGGNSGGGGPALSGLSIEGVSVKDARVRFQDRAKGQDFTVENVNLTLGSLTPGKPTDLTLTFDFSSKKPEMTLSAESTGVLTADVAAGNFSLKDSRTKLTATGPAIPGKTQTAKIGADISVTGNGDRAVVENLSVEAVESAVTGGVTAKNLKAAPAFEGSVALARTSPKKIMEALGMAPMETTDPKALTALSASASFAGTPEKIVISTLSATLDQTRVTGKATAGDFSKPAVTFDFAADALDADRYLPPKKEGEAKEAKKEGSTGGSAGETQVNTAPLKTLVLDGKLALAKGKASGMEFTDAVILVKAKNGVLKVEKAEAKLYNGSVSATASLDVNPDPPVLAAAPTVKSVAFGPLLKAATGTETLTGIGDLTANVKARGLTPESIKESLSGSLAFDVKDGSIRGVNVGNLVRSAWSAVKGGAASFSGEGTTDFVGLSAKADLADGIIQNQDLSLTSPIMDIAGKGLANLLQKTVDYNITTKVHQGFEGLGTFQGVDLSQIPVPIQISGSFDKLSYLPNIKALAAELLRSKTGGIEKKIEEALPKELLPKDKDGKSPVDALKGLFN